MTLEKEKDLYIHIVTAFTVLLLFLSGRLIVTFACHITGSCGYVSIAAIRCGKGSTPVYQLVEISPTS